MLNQTPFQMPLKAGFKIAFKMPQKIQKAGKTALKSCFLASFLSLSLFAASAESEHPPLSAETKKAIAAYKRNPNATNKQNLLNALNHSYDSVIAQKQEKLKEREKNKDKNINSWLKAVKMGKNPPFMSLETPNKKGAEREAVAKAISTYRENANSQSEKAVKDALSAYYEAFLNEQRQHIKETQDLRDERIQASLERFTSERFNIKQQRRAKADEKDILAEIIAAYLNAGAVFVPVNPESRVREREFNAQINAAQKAYLADKSAENKAKLRTQIKNAFETAYKVRLSEFANAEKKGLGGAKALYDKMQDEAFLKAQHSELSEQRNLYGRIDRLVSFEADFSGISPRLKDESSTLYKALKSKDGTSQGLFNALYEKMLILQKEHFKARENQLESFVDELLSELTS